MTLPPGQDRTVGPEGADPTVGPETADRTAEPEGTQQTVEPEGTNRALGPEGAHRTGHPVLRPIGRVENGLPLGTPRDTLVETVSRIVLDPDLAPGLDGLEQEPRILVVFHFHLAEDFELHQHPRGDPSRPRRGVFALRSPRRPNPIGVTEVELLEIRGNLLLVRGLDAVDGTPVLDLKPA
jgi:tRNA (adenine37-N6)-methyltransferase